MHIEAKKYLKKDLNKPEKRHFSRLIYKWQNNEFSAVFSDLRCVGNLLRYIFHRIA